MLMLEVLVWFVLLTGIDAYLQGQSEVSVREEPGSKAAVGLEHVNLLLLYNGVPKNEISYSRKGEKRENVNNSRQMTGAFSQMPKQFLVLVWIIGILHPSVSSYWKARKC